MDGIYDKRAGQYTRSIHDIYYNITRGQNVTYVLIYLMK
jgi:hypothetical protein